MIIYRAPSIREHTTAWLARLRRDAAAAGTDHERARDLLVELGMVESAVADAMGPACDTLHPTLARLREATIAAARLLGRSWDGAPVADVRDAARDAARAAADALDTVAEAAALPEILECGVPEGYAYYGLYPEQYFEAARRVARARRPRHAVCVGIRGIGTSLAAAAAAALEASGCSVSSYTVRPRGHPYDRRLALSHALSEALRANASSALFVVTDEGPGLSGSSFAAVSSALGALGVSDDRIVLLPSWVPDGSAFVSRSACERWRRHAKYVAGFEELWVDSGRLARAAGFPGATLVDWSAGRWRAEVMRGARAVPAVQPQHERRKYLLRPHDAPPVLLKFAGIGGFGRAAFRRAQRLGDAGWSPAPLASPHGFVATPYIPGAPLSAGDAKADVAERVAEYLAFVSREFRTSETAGDDLTEMIETNVGEGLGIPASALGAVRRPAGPSHTAVLDGRMFPHDWLRAGPMLLKTDATDHGEDHFFPGPRDIAWDVAAALEELRPTPAAARRLVARYSMCAGDSTIAARLPFYRVAYLAFRLGYATHAANATAGTDDGARWRALHARNAVALRNAIAGAQHAA